MSLPYEPAEGVRVWMADCENGYARVLPGTVYGDFGIARVRFSDVFTTSTCQPHIFYTKKEAAEACLDYLEKCLSAVQENIREMQLEVSSNA